MQSRKPARFRCRVGALLLIGSAAFASLQRKATLTDSGRMTGNSSIIRSGKGCRRFGSHNLLAVLASMVVEMPGPVSPLVSEPCVVTGCLGRSSTWS